jgi:hypothetical protein
MIIGRIRHAALRTIALSSSIESSSKVKTERTLGIIANHDQI